MMEKHLIEEFTCIWFETSQKWVVVFPDTSVLDEDFGAIGYAVNAAFHHLNRAECEFITDENTGSFFRYVKDEEYWNT